VQTSSENHPSDKNIVFRLWKGEDRLWRAFWLAWLLGGVLIGLATAVLVDAGLLSALMAAVARVFYIIYSSIAVWRNAFNCDKPVWGYGARLLMVVSIAALVFDIARQWTV